MIQKTRLSSTWNKGNNADDMRGGYNWSRMLPALLHNCNSTYHRTIKQRAKDVFDGAADNEQILAPSRPNVATRVRVGDLVRIRLKKGIFAKGDEITYSLIIYKVHKQIGRKFQLKQYITQTTARSVVSELSTDNKNDNGDEKDVDNDGDNFDAALGRLYSSYDLLVIPRTEEGNKKSDEMGAINSLDKNMIKDVKDHELVTQQQPLNRANLYVTNLANSDTDSDGIGDHDNNDGRSDMIDHVTIQHQHKLKRRLNKDGLHGETDIVSGRCSRQPAYIMIDEYGAAIRA
jgi:hypothetical protein